MLHHTPGPWAIIADVPGAAIGFRAIVQNDDGMPGETICNPSPMGEANARLIAAAPDMLAALQAVALLLEHPEAGDIDADKVARAVDAALRAATGEA